MSRNEIKRVYKVGARTVNVRFFEQIGPEDCYSVLTKAVLHRYATGEDVVPTISRELKDAMIKTRLVI